MAYISTDDVRKIRQALKAEFDNIKFSVRNSNKTKVIVTIKSGKVDFSDLLDDTGYQQINHYYLDRYGHHKPIFEKIEKIIKTAPERGWYDNSNIQTDYFDTSFYFDIQVGQWDKPYMQT